MKEVEKELIIFPRYQAEIFNEKRNALFLRKKNTDGLAWEAAAFRTG